MSTHLHRSNFGSLCSWPKLPWAFAFFILFLSFAALNVSATVVTVSPSNPQGWVTIDNTAACGGVNTGSTSYVNGPGTPPIGVGSVRVTTGSNGNTYWNFRNANFNGTPLSQITALSFDTYVASNLDNQAPFFRFEISTLGNNVYDAALVFEPAYQTAAYNPGNPQPAVALGVWQHWEGMTGKWYGTPGSGPGANTKTLAEVLAAFPNAEIVGAPAGGGVRMNAGCGAPSWTNFDGNFDNLTIGVSGVNTTYDFEPVTTVVVDADGFGSVADCNDATPAYSTIQSAIDAVVSGYTIKVCPGTYADGINLNKSLVLQGPNAAISPNGGSRVAEAIITGGSNPSLRISTAGNTSTIDGFTFNSTGVLDSYDPVKATIRKDIFSNGNSGGTIYFLNNPPQLTIDDNHLTNAVTPDNDAIFIAGNWNGTTGTSATITNNVIDNTPTALSSGMNLSNVSGTISGNHFTNLLYYGILLANNSSNMTVSNNVFDTMVNPSPATVPTYGSGIRTYTPSFTGPVNIVSNTFKNSYAGVGIRGVPNDPGANITGMDIHVNFNRFVNNTYGISYGAAGPLDAQNNWWGCNYGPGNTGAGCPVAPNGVGGAGSANINSNPWLTLTTSASPPSVSLGNTSAINSLLTVNSNNLTPGGGFVPNGIPATFTPTDGTVAPPTSTTTSGSTGTTFTATVYGAGGVATTIDGQTVSAAIDVLPLCASVSTPTLTSKTNVPVIIPVNTTDLTTRGVISADFTFNYNPAVLDPTPANISVTKGSVLSPSALVNINKGTAGTIIVSVYDSAPFSGTGPVVNINMRVIGAIGSVTPLTLNNFRYNGGLICITGPSNGTLTVISGTITGQVTYENAAVPVVDVRNVTLTAPGSPTVTGITDANGNYSLSGFGPGTYTVTPSKPDMVYTSPNGIFSDDAALVSQYVVQLISLNPTQVSAGKVSGLPNLSSFDAALIAQWIVGIPNPINQTGKWKFTPPNGGSFVVNADVVQNYTALLMGDVNGDWANVFGARPSMVAANDARAKDAVRASLPNTEASQGSVVTVPFRIDNLLGKSVGSYQFDIEYDPAVIEPVNSAADVAGTISNGLGVVSNAPQPGLLKVVVYGALPVSGDGVYVNLRFSTIGSAGSNSPLTIQGFRFNDGAVPFTTVNGQISVTAAANNASIHGRLLTSFGQGIGNTRVILTSTTGVRSAALSSSFGYFNFSGLDVGETYTVTVQAKRYKFSPRTVSVNNAVTDLDMIADQ